MDKRKKGANRGWLLPLIAVCIAALVVGGLLDRSGLVSLRAETSEAYGSLRFSEVQSHNVLTLTESDGLAPSWIEIENGGTEAVSLHGACLIRDAMVNKTFVFPDITLDGGECIVVYADSRAVIGADGSLHAGFNLPAAGGATLYLLDPAQNLLDSVELPGMAADESWCRQANGEWAISVQATPGRRNEVLSSRTQSVQSGPVALNEAMTSNVTVFPDEDGEYGDYLELCNLTDREVSLAGYWLSDNAAKPNKWRLPNVTLPANGCLAIHCSGKDRTSNPGHLHTSFRLSGGETVFLTSPEGRVVSVMSLPELACGQAWSRADGWTDALAPTPNLPNTYDSGVRLDAQLRAARGGGLYISELMAEPETEQYDWVEIYNASGTDVDLSGYGLSDRPDHPRKWQFPAGTTLHAYEYTAVFMTGIAGGKTGRYLSAPFALDGDGGFTMCLSDAGGRILDAMFVPQQYLGISYGRSETGDCGYFSEPTPLSGNGARALKDRAPGAKYSVSGGLFSAGESFSVSLTAPSGGRIYYTLDCSAPDERATLYTGSPIAVSGTTILRTVVYQDGCLPSQMDTQSYLYDVNAASDAPYVVSLVSDPVGLYSDETGIMVMGPNATQGFPYGSYGRGANFWMDWEREAHVELFIGDTGESALSQECGIKLHGRNTRAYELKCFKVMARGRYGKKLFSYPIFDDRPYDEYEAFILRYSGQDYKSTFMRDAVLTSLAANTSVMYMEAEECICYLNGEYYSAMYIRENISPFSLARREGWAGQEDALDLVKSGYEVKQGSNESYIALKAWLDSHDNTTEEAYAYIDRNVDIDNFLEYAAMQVILGPPDTVNVKRYRNTAGDGKWRWVIYDVDRAMREDIDGFALLAQGTNAQLFRACMANPTLRDRFIDTLNTALATYMSSQNMYDEAQAQFERIKPLLPDYLAKVGVSQGRYGSALKSLIYRISVRPQQVLKECAAYLNLSEEEASARFADAIAAMRAYSGNSAAAEAAAGGEADVDDGLQDDVDIEADAG